MESKGILKSITKDWVSGKFLLTFELEQDISGQLEGIKDKLLRVTAKLWREKRSLDANAYYWVLISKLSEVLKISKSRAHNLMLRRYGQDEIYEGKLIYVIIPDTEEAEEKALESDTFHIRPTSEVNTDKDGMGFRTYIMRKGSSQYDTREMSQLINGLVTECNQMGIETLPADELRRMMEMYEQHYRKKVSDE